MRRDMELIRLLLLEVEGEEPKPDMSPYSEEKQVYHMALSIEAGLIDGEVIPDGSGYPASAVAIKLTWAGHEFLDAARNQTVWAKVTKQIKTSGVEVTIGILKQLLTNAIKDQLGLSCSGDAGN